MAKAAEQLFLKHDRERGAAHDEAKRIANRVIVALSSVRSANAFKELDCAEMLHDVQTLSELQLKYLAEDRATREAAGEAF